MTSTRRAALLPVSFFERPTDVVARELIGRVLVSGTGTQRTVGRIVETEAYLGHRDPASHGFANRRHGRNETLYAAPGTWYVYLSYGVHWCANLVCERETNAGAVLLRALEPIDGLAVMRVRRGTAAGRDLRLAAGPARLCQAMGIDRALDGHDLTLGERLFIADVSPGARDRIARTGIVTGPRIGVAYAGADWASRPWRFGVRGHPSLSRPFPLEP